MAITFESLPVELIADVLAELDLESIIKMSHLSRRFHHITSDPSLNPWRRPILRNLRSGAYERCLKHLSVRLTVPRQNWVEILSIARPEYLLYEATLPNLKEPEWEESFKRRFLPGWRKWKRDGGWKELFMKILYRVAHRSTSMCTMDEAWTKYIVLNRNGSANQLETSSRNFNPMALFNELKSVSNLSPSTAGRVNLPLSGNLRLQNNLAHLETGIRLIVEFADVRVLAFGTLNKPRSPFSVNPNAHMFLHPPGIGVSSTGTIHGKSQSSSGHDESDQEAPVVTPSFHGPPNEYDILLHPLPSPSHSRYPFHTPGGGDTRWVGPGEAEEEGLQWVGCVLITAQILGPRIHEAFGDGPLLQDLDLVIGLGRNQYGSFTWPDFEAIAPWMEEKITKRIDGPGLGN